MTQLQVLENPQPEHNPLGLPKGSVRALLALSVFGTLMGVLLQGRVNPIPDTTFWYLWMVNYAVLAYYFANRQQAPATISAADVAQPVVHPLGLPRGSVRWMIILMFVGTGLYLGYRWWDGANPPWKHHAFFPMLALGGFFLGRVFHFVMSRRKGPSTPLDRMINNGKALLSLGTAAILISTILGGVDLPMKDALQRFSFVYIIFYFGAR